MDYDKKAFLTKVWLKTLWVFHFSREMLRLVQNKYFEEMRAAKKWKFLKMGVAFIWNFHYLLIFRCLITVSQNRNAIENVFGNLNSFARYVKLKSDL